MDVQDVKSRVQPRCKWYEWHRREGDTRGLRGQTEHSRILDHDAVVFKLMTSGLRKISTNRKQACFLSLERSSQNQPWMFPNLKAIENNVSPSWRRQNFSGYDILFFLFFLSGDSAWLWSAVIIHRFVFTAEAVIFSRFQRDPKRRMICALQRFASSLINKSFESGKINHFFDP